MPPNIRSAHRLAVLGCVVVCVGALLPRLTQLDGYATHDEGMFAETLLLMSNGYRPYVDTFYGQGPLFLGVVYPFWAHLGESLVAARLGIALVSLVGVAGAWWSGYQLGGPAGGLLAGGVFAASPLSLAQARAFHTEAPAVAFASVAVAAALAYSRGAGWWSLILAGLSMGASLSVKPLALGAAAAMLALILLRPEARRSQRLLTAAAAAALSIVVLVLASLPFGLLAVAETLVVYRVGPDWLIAALYGSDQGRLSLRTAFPLDVAVSWQTLAGALHAEGFGIVVLGVAGAVALAIRRAPAELGLLVWPLAQLAVLLMHTPLHDRHVLSILAPLAVLGASLVPRLSGWRQNPGLAARVSVLVGIVGLAAYSLGAPAQVQALSDALRPSKPSGVLLEASQLVAASISPDQFVFTDHNFAAVLARRMVPPPLVDLDNHRIRTRWITPEQTIAAVERYDVRAAVIWQPGVSYYDQLPGVLDWLRAHFQAIWVGEREEIVAVRRTGNPDPNTLLGHRSINDVEFENGLHIRAIQAPSQHVRGRELRVRLLWERTNVMSGPVISEIALRSDDNNSVNQVSSSAQVLGRLWTPPERWQVGDVGAELHSLEVPRTSSAGPHRLYVGLKDNDGRPIRAVVSGRPVWHDLIEIASIQVIAQP